MNDKLIGRLNLVDYGVAFATLAAGLAQQSWWLVAAGLLGLVMARVNIPRKLQAKLSSYRRRRLDKTPETSAPAQKPSEPQERTQSVQDYRPRATLHPGELTIGSSRFSLLRDPRHLRH